MIDANLVQELVPLAPKKPRKPYTKRSPIEQPKKRRRWLGKPHKHLNLRLTLDESDRLRRIARYRHTDMQQLIYPLILEYLKACAPVGDRHTLMHADLVLKDDYWGTADEVMNPRTLPAAIQDTDEPRPFISQQFMSEIALMHLRGIERFYGIKLHNLAASAINWFWLRSVGNINL